MAVLYRTNAQSARFEEALGRDRIPFRVRGGDPLPRPTRGAGRAREAAARPTRDTPGRPFAAHLADLTAEAAEASEERREHVDALVRLGHEYLAADGGTGSLGGFLALLEVALRGSDDDGHRAATRSSC